MNLTRGLFIKCVLGVLLLAPFIIFYGCGALPPSIGITITPAPPIIVGTTATLSCEASTDTGSALTYAWSATGGTLSSTAGKVAQWTAPLTVGTYVISVSVSDGSQTSTATSSLSVIVNTPSITLLTATPASVSLGATSILSCEATSPNGKTPTITWTNIGGTLSSTSGNRVSWTAPATAGTSTIGVTVDDTLSKVTGTIMIDATSAPIIKSLTSNDYSITAGESVTLTCSAESAITGGTVTYLWSGGAGGALSSTTGSSIQWTTPTSMTAQTSSITVQVTDQATALTASATSSINVLAATGPLIQSITSTIPSYPPGLAVDTAYTLTCNMLNDSSHTLFTYNWTSDGGGSFAPSSGYTTSWTSPHTITSPTTVTLTVTVADPVTGIIKTATTSGYYK